MNIQVVLNQSELTYIVKDYLRLKGFEAVGGDIEWLVHEVNQDKQVAARVQCKQIERDRD